MTWSSRFGLTLAALGKGPHPLTRSTLLLLLWASLMVWPCWVLASPSPLQALQYFQSSQYLKGPKHHHDQDSGITLW